MRQKVREEPKDSQVLALQLQTLAIYEALAQERERQLHRFSVCSQRSR